MLERTKKEIKKASTFFVSCLSLFFAGMLSSQSTFVSQETTYKQIAKISEANTHNLAYATICFGEKGKQKALNAFNALWGSNFSGTSQLIPACLNAKTNEMKAFKAEFDGSRTVYIGSLSTYSNQKNLKRFETAWINIYEGDYFSPYSQSGGDTKFVFIPDFYADEIIANSNGAYKSYDDLLPSSFSYSASSCRYITINDGEFTREWPIVGVYHAKGFDNDYLEEEYVYNDGDFGDAINLFGAPFLIAYDSAFFTDRLNGMAILSTAKQYSVEEKIKSVAVYDEDKSSNVSFYSVRNGEASEMEGYSDISTAYLFQSDVGPLYFVFMALTALSTIAFYFLVRSLPYEKPLPFLCYSALGPFIFALLGPACANFFGVKLPCLYSFFSYYFGAFAIIVLGIALGFFVYNEKKKRETNDEK